MSAWGALGRVSQSGPDYRESRALSGVAGACIPHSGAAPHLLSSPSYPPSFLRTQDYDKTRGKTKSF